MMLRETCVRGLGAALLLLAACSASAQTSPDEQARRLLEDGRGYRAQGKTKQALDSFETIVSGFQNTDSVDDALLEIGRYRLEAADANGLGELFARGACWVDDATPEPKGRFALLRDGEAARIGDDRFQLDRFARP